MSKDSSIEWRARIFADNTLKAEVQKEINKLALVLLGNNKLKIRYNKEGFNHIRQNDRPYTYMGSWREWMVFGHSKTDIYLEVLKMLANDSSTYYPVVSYRLDDEWIEVERYKELNDEFEKLKDQAKMYEKTLIKIAEDRSVAFWELSSKIAKEALE